MNKHTTTQNIRRSVKLSALALVAGSALLLSGCGPSVFDTKEAQIGAFTTIRVEGCQYLVRADGYRGYMSHKGNCDNPIHTHNGGNHE